MADTFRHSTTNGRPAPDMGIAWEFLPSLKYLLAARREPGANRTPVWSDTEASGFEATMSPPEETTEPLPGMTVREVNEPDIFKAFFETPKAPPAPKR